MPSPSPASPVPHDEVGGTPLHDILPSYEVLDLLGRGGMGVVYKARQVSLDRLVAIKLLPREILREDLDFKERFKQEARTMAKLSHPGIVAVHDFGETEDRQLFFVMEFIDGTDLAKVIEQRGVLPVEEALRIFRAVAEALVYAHDQGVIHRDIKPANVLIKSSGEVKVADFGLAKIITPGTVGLTATSTSMGSHDFAAPEIFVHGGEADHRADVYSLGVMLYQMLTGVIPRGMFKLPSERVPGLDPRFDEVICKALEQDREDRFQSVSEMIAAMQPSPLAVVPGLADAEGNAGKMPVAVVRRRLHWQRVTLAVASVLLLGFAGKSIWLGWSDEKAVADQQRASDSAEATWQSMLTSDGGKLRRSWQGNWGSNGGSLVSPPATATLPALCGLSLSSTESCDLRFRLTKTDGDDGLVHFGFRHAGFCSSIVFSDRQSRDGSSFVGLARLDDKAAEKDSAWVKQRQTPFLSIGQMHEVLLQVRDEGVIVLLDGAEVYRWTGDWGRTDQHRPLFNPELTKEPVYAVGTYKSRILLHAAEYRLIKSEQGKPLPTARSSTGEWQDVLAQMDLTAHRRSGRWRNVQGGLENTDAVAGGSLEFPVKASGPSDLKLTLRRLSTSSGKMSFTFHNGAYGGQFSLSDYSRPSVGLEYVDGKSMAENSLRVEHPAAYLTIGHAHELLLQLREQGMAVNLDGRQIFRWEGDWSRLTQAGTKIPEALKDKNAFAIYVGNGRLRVEGVAFREVHGDEGKVVPPWPADGHRSPPLPEAQVFAGNGHRYQYIPGFFTWNEADANARSLGGHLVTLTSQEENDWVWSTFSPWVPGQLPASIRTRGWWTGGMRDLPSEPWTWVTGEPFGFTRLEDKDTDTPARVPRLLQHDNGGGILSLWRTMHYSAHYGFVVEWE